MDLMLKTREMPTSSEVEVRRSLAWVERYSAEQTSVANEPRYPCVELVVRKDDWSVTILWEAPATA